MYNITIEKRIRVDAYGKESTPVFVIKWQVKRFFRKPKWIYLERDTSTGFDAFIRAIPVKFSTQEEAQLVIDKYLSKGIKVPTIIKEDLK